MWGFFCVLMFNFFKKTEKKSASPIVSSFFNMFSNKLFGKSNDFLDEYKDWVYLCVSLIAQEVSSAHIRLYKQKIGRGGKIDKQELTSHPLLDLLNSPNPMMSRGEFLEAISSYVDLDGNAYIWKARVSKEPKKLYPLRPDVMKPILDKESGFVVSYSYDKGSNDITSFDPKNIIHIKNFNPKWINSANPLRGIGRVEASKSFINEEATIREWNKNFIENGASPSGVLEYDGELNQEGVDTLRAKFKQKFQGAGNSGEIPFLQGGLKYRTTQISQREMAFIDQRKLDRDDIFALFGVPKGLLISEGVNLANAQQALWSFTRFTIKPRLTKIQDALNSGLVKDFGDDLVLEFDNPVPEDRQQEIAEYTAGFGKWLTTNEIREEEGLPPIDGGDVIALTQPSDIAPVIAPKTVKKDVNTEMNARDIIGTEAWKKMIKTQKPFEKKYKSALEKYFDELKNRIAQKYTSTKAVGDDLIDGQQEVETVFDILTPLQKELFLLNAKQALDALGIDTDFEYTAKISDALDSYNLKLSKTLVSTTTDQIKTILRSAIDQGLGPNETADLLDSRLTELGKNRSQTIARTETIRTNNLSTNEAWKQSGVVEYKEWFTATDERVCPFCGEIDGKKILMDDNFFDKGDEFLGMKLDFTDTTAPPLHANCRCTLLPILFKD